MKALVYVSEQSITFDQLLLDNLTLQSAHKNKALKITGYLYYEKGRFIQYIEGDEFNLNILFDLIKKDDRHKILNVITQDISHRRFPNWRMNQLRKGDFVRTKMENLITDLLLLKSNHIVDQENKWDKMAWEMVDRMAKLNTIKNPFA